ncbi:hypothetical protein DFQ30_008839 [Apophysomyces sp. BC1015]|nr:hypothetical protein DFQ30_008839 [Apophysomyces sp. BC1015]
MVMQTGIQAMCNMITGDSVTLDDVWASWMTDEKQTIWRYSIISQLISYGYFTEIFQMLQDQDDVNNRQTTLLKCLDSKVHAYSGDYPDFLGQKEYTQVTALLVDLGRKAVQVMQEVQQSGPDEKSTLDVEKVSQVYSCLVLALQLLSGLRAKDTGNEELKYILVRADTLTVVTDLLRYLETMDLTKGNTPKLGFDYLKRESVRFIGAVCYQDKDMQDKLRDIGGISLVLAQCKIDDANPCMFTLFRVYNTFFDPSYHVLDIREHAILALRNIVEHNEENQRLIRELQPISAVQTPELSEMGLRATLADGKVKLSKHEN